MHQISQIEFLDSFGFEATTTISPYSSVFDYPVLNGEWYDYDTLLLDSSLLVDMRVYRVIISNKKFIDQRTGKKSFVRTDGPSTLKLDTLVVAIHEDNYAYFISGNIFPSRFFYAMSKLLLADTSGAIKDYFYIKYGADSVALKETNPNRNEYIVTINKGSDDIRKFYFRYRIVGPYVNEDVYEIKPKGKRKR